MFLENILTKISKILVDNDFYFKEMDIILFQDFIEIQFVTTAIFNLPLLKEFERVTDEVNIFVSQNGYKATLCLTIWK